MVVAQERNDQESVRFAHAVNSARSAFRHAVEALDRMPQLGPEDMEAVQRLIDEFRSALSDLNK